MQDIMVMDTSEWKGVCKFPTSKNIKNEVLLPSKHGLLCYIYHQSITISLLLLSSPRSFSGNPRYSCH